MPATTSSQPNREARSRVIAYRPAPIGAAITSTWAATAIPRYWPVNGLDAARMAAPTDRPSPPMKIAPMVRAPTRGLSGRPAFPIRSMPPPFRRPMSRVMSRTRLHGLPPTYLAQRHGRGSPRTAHRADDVIGPGHSPRGVLRHLAHARPLGALPWEHWP